MKRCRVVFFSFFFCFENCPVRQANMIKFGTDAIPHLGLTVCANFQFSEHVRRILLKESRRIGLFRCFANHLPRTILESVYVSYIRPVFEDASPVLHGSIKADEASAFERLKLALRVEFNVLIDTHLRLYCLKNCDGLAFVGEEK